MEQLEEPPEKPGVLKILTPFAATGLIFWWIFRGMDIVGLKAALGKAHFGLAVGVMTAYCMIFFMVDLLSFGYGYKWYLTKKVGWKDIAIIRWGMYLPQVALAPIAEIIPPTYFRRTWRAKVLHTIGSEIYVLFCDSYCNVAVLSLGLLLAGMSVGMGWIYFVTGMWVLLALTWLYWLTPLRDRLLPKLRDNPLMHSFKKAPLKHYFAFFGIRSILALSNLVAGWTLLEALDVRLPVTHLMLLVPVMMVSTFLPISAGGYGGPQGAAVLLLVQLWNHTDSETAVAYSLLWSTFFAFGRAFMGAVFAWPVWNLLRKKTYALEMKKPEAETSGADKGE